MYSAWAYANLNPGLYVRHRQQTHYARRDCITSRQLTDIKKQAVELLTVCTGTHKTSAWGPLGGRFQPPPQCVFLTFTGRVDHLSWGSNPPTPLTNPALIRRRRFAVCSLRSSSQDAVPPPVAAAAATTAVDGFRSKPSQSVFPVPPVSLKTPTELTEEVAGWRRRFPAVLAKYQLGSEASVRVCG